MGCAVVSSYGGETKCTGQIVTIKLKDSNKDLKELLQSEGNHRVVVVDVDEEYVAIVGDNLLNMAKINNWMGIIVNGYIRDTLETKLINVGLWALGTCPKRSTALSNANLNVTLSFGGVIFNPDDYIYADNDGIILAKELLVM